ncbi:MAG: hypothetical protein IJB64_10150 [Akkermansia sp.]|nr:hypothetical protein [Akkermansia sp.]
MDLSFEDLTRLGCRQFSVDYMSMAADVLRMEFCGTLLEHAPLPFAAGDALRLMQGADCVFRGWVTSVEPAMDTQVWVTRVEVQNVVAVLDALPVEVSSYETEQRLESARELVQQALGAARRCALLVGESFAVELEASVMAVFSSGTESVWSNILAATRWVPNAASWYDHGSGTLHLLGGTVAAGSKASGRVVFGADTRSGVLVVGSSRLSVTEEWTAEPARVAARLLRGSMEVAATAVDAYTLELVARAPGAAGNEIELAFEAGAEGDVATVEGFSGGDESVGLQLATMESLQGAELPGSVVSVSSSVTAWEVPPVVALRGRYEFTLPSGASIYQPGAFVYHVPKKEVSAGGGDVESAAVQRAGGEWNVVKGYEVPPGWQTVNGGEAVDMRVAVSGAPGLHHEFWARYLPEIRKTNVSCLAFGPAVFEPMPVAEAYPEAEEDNEVSTLAGVVKWRPPLLESKNGPANYKEFNSGEDKNLYVCYEGQFPASSESRGNVSGLKFCRGTLRQFVWLKSEYTGVLPGTEVTAFFAGSMKVTGDDGKEETVSYTQLTLDGVFINRRRTRYQSGTNGQPEEAESPEPEPDVPAGGSTELTKRDYIQALTDYYYSSRPVGTHGSMQLAEVSAYRHGAGLGVLKSVRWNPATGALTLTTGAGGPVGVEAILQRQQVGKMQALADLQEDLAQESQPISGETEDTEEETESYPMVGGGASAGHRVDAKAARLEPFAVYMEDDGRMMMNGGPLPSPVGIIDVEPQDISAEWQAGREFYVKARWNRSTKQWEAVVLYRDPKTSES